MFRVEAEDFPTHAAAAAREREAIRSLRPVHNVVFHPENRPAPLKRPAPPLAGTPDDLLGYAQIAEFTAELGRPIKTQSLRAMRASGRMPAPDDRTVPDRPRWRRSTVVEWLDARPGQGTRTDLRPKT